MHNTEVILIMRLSIWWRLGSFWNGVLGKLTGEEETDSSLDLSGWESVLLVVADETGWFAGDLLEDVVNEGVHDWHWLLGDTGLWVNLFKDTVDVDWESLTSSLSWGCFLDWGSGFCWSSTSWFLCGGHFYLICYLIIEKVFEFIKVSY